MLRCLYNDNLTHFEKKLVKRIESKGPFGLPGVT